MENNLAVTENEEVNEKPKVEMVDIRPFGLNRKLRRGFTKRGIEFKPVEGRKQFVNPNKEFKQFRKEIARKHGSTTGQLKKKHINKEMREQGVRND